MPVAKRETSDGRVIAHVDMDCFYVQVEQRKQPNLRGLPTAVIQYNSFKGGALIAVSYEARNFGVKRSMRGDEAKDVCPQIHLVQVPVAHGKADLNSYRNAGSEVVSILSKKGRCERASIDEVYLDLTDAAETMLLEMPPEAREDIEEEVLKSHVLGLEIKEGIDAKEEVRKWIRRGDATYQDKLLACGAFIVANLRMQVLKDTEFTCSAGIAHNKMLAKLASGMNKPAQQTVVPQSSVGGLLESLPIKKMKQLGGKLGSSLQSDLGCKTVGDLLQFSEEKLQQCYGINTGNWLWNIARGINGEEVEGRLLPKSHGSGKTFPGPQALKTLASVQHWLNELCEELSERLQSDLNLNKRIAHTLTLHARAYKKGESDSLRKFPSKSCPLRYGTTKIQEDALTLFQAALREFLGFCISKTHGNENNNWGVTSLSVSASKIVPIPSGTHSIVKYFGGQVPSSSSFNQPLGNAFDEAVPSSPSGSENCSGLISYELQQNYPGGDTEIKNSEACLHEQDPLCNLSRKVDSLPKESSLESPAGSEDRTTKSEPYRELPAKDPRPLSSTPSLKAVEKKKTMGNNLKDFRLPWIAIQHAIKLSSQLRDAVKRSIVTLGNVVCLICHNGDKLGTITLMRLTTLSLKNYHQKSSKSFKPGFDLTSGLMYLTVKEVPVLLTISYQTKVDEMIWSAVHSVLPPVEFACVYGSSLHPNNHDKTTMTDFILGVSDPKQWHSENLRLNKNHYASWMVHLGGGKLITNVADRVGVGVHFNPFVTWNGKMYKYGVVRMFDLINDVLQWDKFYLCGRLQKPVHIVVDNLDINSCNAVNLRAALSTALLLLPSEFSEADLYAKVCSLSYMGDLRMLFAEDKNKVKKIVAGQFDLFHSMYQPFLEECEAKKLLRLSSTANHQIVVSQDHDLSVVHSLVSALPRPIRSSINMKQEKKLSGTGKIVNDIAISSREQAANCLERILRRKVMVSSARQAISGLLAVGGVNATKYLAKKVNKAWKNCNIRQHVHLQHGEVPTEVHPEPWRLKADS
ncbi:hypothetical protein Ahy_B03g062018 isoform B [Arachis hypogaea]|uniref:DNA polymerase eta n=1 Tax=Arachis hypogaea TaxID=3818 RepID=A0A444ZST7_ARAHY|nr:hypothetical protein Ahy_B03g062018 isoform B [Arachis hypogaea]